MTAPKPLFFAGLLAVSFSVGWSVQALPVFRDIWWLIAASAVVAAVPLGTALLTRHFDIFEPVHLFAFSYLILFVIRPAVDFNTPGGPLAWLGYSLRSTYSGALLVGLAGALAFYIGYYVRIGRQIGTRLPTPSGVWARADLNAFVLTAIVISVTVFGEFIRRRGIGSVANLFHGRTLLTASAYRSSSGYLYTAPLWLTSIGILILVLARRWWSAEGVVAFALLAFSQVMTIGGGDRSWTLPVGGMVFVVGYLRRRRRPSAPVLVTAIVLVFLFNISAVRDYRTSTLPGTSVAEYAAEPVSKPGKALQDFFGGADTAMAANLAVELQFVPSRIDFALGRTYANAAALPVPRAVWHHKPPVADTELTAAIFPAVARAGGGFSFSLFGEPYLNFGYFGVIGISMLLGIASRALYAWFLRAPRNPTVIAFYALNWPFLLVYMRGGLGVDYQRQVIVVSPLIAAAAFAQVRRHRLLPADAEVARPRSA